MIDIGKQIEHWRSGAVEDWNVANSLVEQGKIRHGLFFAHLALDLEQRDLLAEVIPFNIEGRYPELYFPAPTPTEADNYLKKIGGLLECLNNLF
ncbi:MAG: hypothetical protein GXP14_00300 [Gammaproteobacteria bacterium]|nr:hypothetical protein [Gammaproteobacteria bacterium]